MKQVATTFRVVVLSGIVLILSCGGVRAEAKKSTYEHSVRSQIQQIVLLLKDHAEGNERVEWLVSRSELARILTVGQFWFKGKFYRFEFEVDSILAYSLETRYGLIVHAINSKEESVPTNLISRFLTEANEVDVRHERGK